MSNNQQRGVLAPAQASEGSNSGGLQLRSEYATRLAELTVPWESARPDDPAILTLNEPVARAFGLDPEWLHSDRGVRCLLGNDLPEGSAPVAQVYSGHQFGSYASRLGDGRALLLGEIEGPSGQLHDVHLKGSGRTPFARADGFAAVGPMLREFLISEAMHALEIPTTRSLAVVETGRMVLRDGDLLPGAVLVRIASSHLRVGTFQYARSTGEDELLKRLADFAIERHYPELASSEAPYAELLGAVVERQARLVASWMLVGFVHGVMNTDNSTVSGETIDYGPCAFLDAYDPAAVFSSIDHAGRYAYGNQPAVAQWNLSRFADALLPLLAGEQDQAIGIAEEQVRKFTPAYEDAWLEGMRAKLGVGSGPEDTVVAQLAAEMLSDLQGNRIDFVGFFRALASAAEGDDAPVLALFSNGENAGVGEWFGRWRALDPDAAEMNRVNPMYVPRNHLVDAALGSASDGDLTAFNELLEVVRNPFSERTGRGADQYARPDPNGSRHVTYCGT
ncbi:MAG: protein adenylyltransferase SelO [Leucobacter sp.]